MKREAARRLLDAAPSGSLAISTQVLGEFYAVTTRKLAQPLSEEDAARAVILTEDLRHGAVILGVRIENPFMPDPRSDTDPTSERV